MFNCPLNPPSATEERILLAHGSGGRLAQWILNEIFLPAFTNPILAKLEDAAGGMKPLTRWAFASDSHVVKPLFFSGGDIGKLALFGTANDLAVSGARPLFMSLNWILEEGLELATLKRIVQSAKEAADLMGVQVVTGDTKVVERGKADGVFISTSGIGEVLPDWYLGASCVQAGDQILLSGDIGRHGLAVLAAREQLGLSSDELVSDCGPLFPAVEALWSNGVKVKVMRDLTRGGLAAACWELAKLSRKTFALEESSLPIGDIVKGSCELLGLDPLLIANEGTMMIIVPKSHCESALNILRKVPRSENACRIGEILAAEDGSPGVQLKSAFGGTRWVDLPAGDPLPRIC